MNVKSKAVAVITKTKLRHYYPSRSRAIAIVTVLVISSARKRPSHMVVSLARTMVQDQVHNFGMASGRPLGFCSQAGGMAG